MLTNFREKSSREIESKECEKISIGSKDHGREKLPWLPALGAETGCGMT
jgi:hypothetical protein